MKGTSYSPAFKEKVVQKLIGPRRISANALSSEIGIPQPTLSRWLREADIVGAMTKPKMPSSPRERTPDEKLRVLTQIAGMNDEELGEFLRKEGLHEAQIEEWKADAIDGLGGKRQQRKSAKEKADARRVVELERDLRRKEKALAEASALLVLKKKAQAIWGDDEDDSTDGKTGR